MRKIALLGALVAMAGCGGGGTIVTRVDEITQRRVDRMEAVRIGPVPCDLTRDPCVKLSLERVILGAAAPRYRIAVVYEGEEWLFIQPGRTLEFELDGEGRNFTLFGPGSKDHRKILGDKKLRETAYYEISPNNLERLAQSRKIRIKLHGDGFYVERGLSSGIRKNIKSFARKFLGK